MSNNNKAPIDYKIIEGNLNDSIKIEGAISNKIEIEGRLSPGARGKSSYELWLDEGNEGSIQDFLNTTDKHFTFNKNIASEKWEIKHNLNKYPSVTIVDSADTVVYGNVEYIDSNKLIITFSVGFAGKAYLN